MWLPLPHVLMLPLVGDRACGSPALAGSIPPRPARHRRIFLFASMRRLLAICRAGRPRVFALNPNLLYLQSIP